MNSHDMKLEIARLEKESARCEKRVSSLVEKRAKYQRAIEYMKSELEKIQRGTPV